jgi:hypothetical protein
VTAAEALQVETTRLERKIHDQFTSFCDRHGIDPGIRNQPGNQVSEPVIRTSCVSRIVARSGYSSRSRRTNFPRCKRRASPNSERTATPFQFLRRSRPLTVRILRVVFSLANTRSRKDGRNTARRGGNSSTEIFWAISGQFCRFLAISEQFRGTCEKSFKTMCNY